MSADHAVFPINGDAREIADMLIRAGQLVEQSGFAAVLVADKSEGQGRAFRERIAAAFGVKTAFLAQTGVFEARARLLGRIFRRIIRDRIDLNIPGIINTQRQLVAMDPNFHRIAHGSQLHKGYMGSGDQAHVEKVLPERALTADRLYAGTVTYF